MSSVAALLMWHVLQAGQPLGTPVPECGFPDILGVLAFLCKSDTNRKPTFAKIVLFILTLLFKYYNWNIRIV